MQRLALTHWAALRVTVGNAGAAPNKPFVRNCHHSLFLDGAQEPETPSPPCASVCAFGRGEGNQLAEPLLGLPSTFSLINRALDTVTYSTLTSLDVMSHVVAFPLDPTPHFLTLPPPALPMENRRDLGSQSGVTRWDLAWMPALRCLTKDYLIWGISLRE